MRRVYGEKGPRRHPDWPPFTAIVATRVTDRIATALRERAEADEESPAELIRRALEHYLGLQERRAHNEDDAGVTASASSELQPARVASG